MTSRPRALRQGTGGTNKAATGAASPHGIGETELITPQSETSGIRSGVLAGTNEAMMPPSPHVGPAPAPENSLGGAKAAPRSKSNADFRAMMLMKK